MLHSHSILLTCVSLWYLTDTFIMMGASLDRVIVLPIGDQTMARTLQSFSEFDVVHADCYQYRDKQHLLAIIESGFGSFAAFNRTVQCLLIERIETVATQTTEQSTD